MNVFSSAWVIVGESQILQNGAVAVDCGRIQAVGQREEILDKYPKAKETRYSCTLMPGLVNAHTHLELTYLGGNKELKDGESFTGWIEELIEKRQNTQVDDTEIAKSIELALLHQYESGVVLVADTGNNFYESSFISEKIREGQLYRMQEFIAPTKESCIAAIATLQEADGRNPITAHSPYSTGPELIQFIKERCADRQQVFSIHTSESKYEHQFLRHLEGPFREFLDKRVTVGQTYTTRGDVETSVFYYKNLGILDERTLLVHCVCVTNDDISVISEYNVKVCLCPRSNRFLKVGKAPIPAMLDAGIVPAIGTDSMASNWSLCMWKEMQQIQLDHPKIPSETILKMATIGGAEALGQAENYGSLQAGKKAALIHVSSEKLMACKDSKELSEVLVSEGKPDVVTHIAPYQESYRFGGQL